MLSADSRHYLASLPRVARVPGLVLAHGSLRDPEEYVRTDEPARRQLEQLATECPGAGVLVVGHTHRAWLYSAGVRDALDPDRVTRLDEGAPHLVKPGSVGQSRQREPRPLARFALLEMTSEGSGARPVSVRFFAVEYDHRAVRGALRAQTAAGGQHPRAAREARRRPPPDAPAAPLPRPPARALLTEARASRRA